MRRHNRIIGLIAALCVPVVLLASGRARSAPQAAATNCLYLPFIGISGTPTAAQPGASSPANCPTPPAQAPDPSTTATTAPAQVTGSARLWPEYAFIPTIRAVNRYVVVLDTSGSMSANFNGQCDNAGTLVQCANGPAGAPPAQMSGAGPAYYWTNPAERRIYVAKKAVERLVRLTNMPGNAGYDAARPDDQMAIVWFNDSQQASGARAFTSNPAQLISFVTDANTTAGDPYRTSGGTNGAAGLYRASLILAGQPNSITFGGQEYPVRSYVILITDGVSNYFLDTTASNLSGGSSSATTYPAGSFCRGLGSQVAESAACQTTEVGGVYNGWDRPITQMINVSQQYLRGVPARHLDVMVIALSNIPSTGLRDGVASSSNMFFALETLVQNPDGTTNVDKVFDTLQTVVEQGPCQPKAAGAWVDAIDAAHMPAGAPALGEVALTKSDTGATFVAPVVRDPSTGRLSYRLTAPPAGDYQLEAFVFYKGDDGATRRYSMLEVAGAPAPMISVSLTGQAQDLGALALRLGGDVCAAP